ncbi:MAG: 5-enolpyruvylshikimate-3-phosphate synthase, partial [Thermodesulfobacteriota bacterium]
LEIMDLPAGKQERIKISVPDAWWGLAVALLSLKRPGIVLDNPGELTRLWPYFWHLYKGLPDPQVTGKRGESSLSETSQRSKRRRKVD